MVIAVRTESGPQGLTVVKTAQTDADRLRLATEADLLRQAAHPGVIEVVDVTPDELRLRHAGTTLTHLMPLAADHAAAVVCAVAEVLDAIHGVGVAHGQLDADHVVLDERGRPRLCGFGHATAIDDRRADAATSDIGDLGALFDRLLDEAAHLPWTPTNAGARHRTRRKYAREIFRNVAGMAQRSDPRQRIAPHQMANAIREALPALELPTPPRRAVDADGTPIAGVSEIPDDADAIGDGGWSSLELEYLSDTSDETGAGDVDTPVDGAGPVDSPTSVEPPASVTPPTPLGPVGTEPTPEPEPRDVSPPTTFTDEGASVPPQTEPPASPEPEAPATPEPEAPAPEPEAPVETTGWAAHTSRPATTPATEQAEPPAETWADPGYGFDEVEPDVHTEPSPVASDWPRPIPPPTDDSIGEDDDGAAAVGLDDASPDEREADDQAVVDDWVDVDDASDDDAGDESIESPAAAMARLQQALASGPPPITIREPSASTKRRRPPPDDEAPPRRRVVMVAAGLVVVGLIIGPLVAMAIRALDDDDDPADGDTAVTTSSTTLPEVAGTWPSSCDLPDLTGPDVDGDGCPEPVTVNGRNVQVGDVPIAFGEDGDLVAVADTDCDGVVTPYLLRPSSGQVFAWAEWPLESAVDVRSTGEIPGATAIERRDGAACDVVVVVAGSAETVVAGTP